MSRADRPVAATRPRGTVEAYNAVGGTAFWDRLLDAWEDEGWTVRRISELNEREYRSSRGIAARVRLRWRMYVGHAWHSARAARAGSSAAPVRVVATNPFYAPAVVHRAAGGRGATINLVYDLYPDALVQSGLLAADAWIVRRGEAHTRRTFRECDATVFLGEHLRRYAEDRYGPARRAAVIPVGADGAPFAAHPPCLRPDGAPVTLLYAGLMSRAHDAATLAGALEAGGPRELRMVFHATGASYQQLRKAAHAAPGCDWRGPLPRGPWQRAMTEADVALVTMADGAERVVMPSKTYSALVAGQAVLAVCPPGSDLAALVRRHRCGWVVAPGDVGGLLRCLGEIARDREALLEARRRAFEAGHRYYDMGIAAKAWLTLFEELQGGRSEARAAAVM